MTKDSYCPGWLAVALGLGEEFSCVLRLSKMGDIYLLKGGNCPLAARHNDLENIWNGDLGYFMIVRGTKDILMWGVSMNAKSCILSGNREGVG